MRDNFFNLMFWQLPFSLDFSMTHFAHIFEVSRTQFNVFSRKTGLRGLILLGATTYCLSACSSTTPLDTSAMLPEDQRVSSVPWAKPESWEGTSGLGPLAQDPRFNGGKVEY